MRLLVVAVAVVAAIVWWSNRTACACTSKATAYMAAVRSDLRNLETAQESYFADHSRYASAADSLSFTATSGVVVAVMYASEAGWSAIGIHQGVGGWCTTYVGEVDPPIAGMQEGDPACRWSVEGKDRERGLTQPKEE